MQFRHVCGLLPSPASPPLSCSFLVQFTRIDRHYLCSSCRKHITIFWSNLNSVPVFTGQLEIYISNITSTWILFLFSLSRPSFSASASTLTSTAYPPFSKFWWNATVDLNHLFLVTGISQRTSAQTWKFYLVAIRVIRHYSYTFRHLLVHRSHDSPET